METLTTEELQILINLVNSANTRVQDAPTFLALVTKMSRMLAEVPQAEKQEPTE